MTAGTSGAIRYWTNHELDVIRRLYPEGGINAVHEALPHRSRSSIYQHARQLGVRRDGICHVRESYKHDPALDAKIRKLHERPLLKGAVKEFAYNIGRPAWWVSKRARDMGLKTPRFKEPDWCEAEIELLHATAHVTPKAAREKLMRAGYRRSMTAIVVKRKRLGVRPDANGYYNAGQVAALMGVDSNTVIRWIRFGELPAQKRGLAVDVNRDNWWVNEAGLRKFVITHPLRVDLKKIPDANRLWFIGLVAGDPGLGSAVAA